MKHLFAILFVMLLATLPACGISQNGSESMKIDAKNSAQSGKLVSQVRSPYEKIIKRDAFDDSYISEEVLPVLRDVAPLTPAEEQALRSQLGMPFNLDEKDEEVIKLYFSYYVHDHRRTFERWLERAAPYLPMIKRIFTERGLPEDLIYLPFAESGFNPWAYSWAGAGGMWQFMPYTGKRFGLNVDWWTDDRRDPEAATIAAADYLTQLYNMFGDWYLALAAYNAGEGRISRAMQKIGADNFFDLARQKSLLAKETQHYVPKFLAIIKIVHNLDALGFKPINWSSDNPMAKMQVKPGTDLNGLAQSCGYGWQEFNQLNPAFRRQVSPPDRATNIYLPEEKVASAESFLSSPQAKATANYQQYRASSRDTWASVSKRFGVPVEVLTRINAQNGKLSAGQVVMIPSKGPNKEAEIASADNTRKTRETASKRANYTVRKGDTAFSVSKRYSIGVSTLLKANGLKSPSEIKVGQNLYIPDQSEPETRVSKKEAEQVRTRATAQAQDKREAKKAESSQLYQVKKGDTLYSIAKRFGVTPEKVLAWNNLNGKTVIKTGDNLKIYSR